MTELMLVARVGAQTIALPAEQVEAVVDLPVIVPIPLAPAHIRGLAAIRSQVVTVVDCAVRVGQQSCGGHRAVSIFQDGHRYAVLVDVVEDVVPCDVVSGVPGAPMAEGWMVVSSGYVDLGGRFAIVVEPARLIFSSAPALAA